MWYVIQTVTGEEPRVKALLEAFAEQGICKTCFVPLYEEVRRSHGEYRIFFKRLFPGYLFVETEDPEAVYATLRKVPEFTRLLGAQVKEEEKVFIPITEVEQEFLGSILEDGVVHVSYIRMEGKRIDKVVGPLSGYRNHIVKLDIPHRRAIVEIDIFGRRRRARFGLWTDSDPENSWLKLHMNREQVLPLDGKREIDIGLVPGDIVTDDTGVYGEYEFVIDKVDVKHRVVFSRFAIGDSIVRIQLDADKVSRIEEEF
ncbi:MAG: hypothetical protein IK152_08135 [Lachnospiraceae bacterium]|nr:hypothetical protein [Lachnospiraceae bacterium]